MMISNIIVTSQEATCDASSASIFLMMGPTRLSKAAMHHLPAVHELMSKQNGSRRKLTIS
jgi:hypothetical protein